MKNNLLPEPHKAEYNYQNLTYELIYKELFKLFYGREATDEEVKEAVATHESGSKLTDKQD
jgi:hypothetical protein